MSLIAHWPLIDDFQNIISDNNLTFNHTDGNTGPSSSSTNALFNSCIERSTDDMQPLVSNKPIKLGRTHSVFCWIRFGARSAATGATTITGICGQHRYQRLSGVGLNLKYQDEDTAKLSISVGNDESGGRAYQQILSAATLTKDTWYHIGYTYDGTTIKLYVNGNLDSEHTQCYTDTNPRSLIEFDKLKIYPDYFMIYAWSFAEADLELALPYSNYRYIGSISDVRLYNNALSNAEIHKLAQALYCHYAFQAPLTYRSKLDRYTADNKRELTLAASERLNYKDIPLEVKLSPSFQDNVRLTLFVGTAEQEGIHVDFKNTGSQARNKHFSIFLQKIQADGTIDRIKPYTVNEVYSNSQRIGYNLVFAGRPGYELMARIYGLRSLQTQPTSVKLYNFNLRFQNSIDISGFKNDPLYNSCAVTSHINVKRGQYSAQFDANDSPKTYIQCPSQCMLPGPFSYNMWAYMSNWTEYASKEMRMISCTQDGGFNIEPTSVDDDAYIRFAVYDSGLSGYNNIIACDATGASMKFADLGTDSWHMFSFTISSTNLATVYIDGVAVGSNQLNGPIGYNPNASLFLGTEAGDENQPDAHYFTGYINEFRLYASCLSAEDILSLYNCPIQVDNKGNMQLFNLQVTHSDEGKSVAFKSTGAIKVSEVCEVGQLTKFIKLKSNGSTANEWNHLTRVSISCPLHTTSEDILISAYYEYDNMTNYYNAELLMQDSIDGLYELKNEHEISAYFSTGNEVIFELKTLMHISSINVRRYYLDNRSYYNQIIQISSDGTHWETVFDSLNRDSYGVDTNTGIGLYAETAAGRVFSIPGNAVHIESHYPDPITLNGNIESPIIFSNQFIEE